MKKFLIFVPMLLVTALVWAADLEVPEGDPTQSLLALILSWKSLGGVGIASGLISVVVQSLRKFLPSSGVKKAVVVTLGVVYAVLQMVLGGGGIMDALVTVLLTSGGAVAIYEWAIKPLFPKQE